jgi:hypothetical protein
MVHLHLADGSNNVHILKRKYIGEGKYFQRGICQNISTGDDFIDRWNKQLKVDKILVQRDSKGIFNNPEDAVNAFYEAEMVDESFNPNIPEKDQTAMNIG